MDPHNYQRGGNEENDVSLSEMNNVSFSNMLLNSSVLTKLKQLLLKKYDTLC